MMIDFSEDERNIIINLVRTMEYFPDNEFGKKLAFIQKEILKKLGTNPHDIKTLDDTMKEQFPISYKK